jgi:hypothetical protein
MGFFCCAHRPRLVVAGAIALLTLWLPALGLGDGKLNLPSCAFGRLPAALRTALPDALAAQRRSFDATLTDLPTADRRRADAAFEAGAAAYLYGMPTVLLRETVRSYPSDALIGLGGLATPRSNSVVSPNHDTLYSVARLDLAAEPVMLGAPATHGRYSVLQLIDANTNVIGYIGSESDRDHASSTLVAAPGWRGTVPTGARVVRSPTQIVWVIGRTLVDGPADTAAATAVMARYTATPLSAWTAGQRHPERVLPHPPNRHSTELPAGLAFYDALGAAMSADPPPTADACALASFAGAGIGPGLRPSSSTDRVLTRALTAARAAGVKLVDTALHLIRHSSEQHNNGWTVLTGDVGRFGTDYANRAVIADVALASNVPHEALYPTADVDARGRPLNGTHSYTVTFARGALPPVRAFWSLTLYDAAHQLYASRSRRYAIGDRTPRLHYNRDRSLTIYIQHGKPAGANAANWLPAPRQSFELYLRLYEPGPAAVNRQWVPPAVLRAR